MINLAVQPGDIWLTCEGINWYGWQSLSIKSSLSQVQHSFEMKTTDIERLGDELWNVKGGSEISIYFRNIRIFTGYVQKYDVSLSADSHEISIAGESKAIDLVQCSHVGNYFWKNVSGETVVKEVVKPFGIPIRIDKKLKPIPKEGLRVAVDSSAFDVIKKVAEQNALLVYTMQSGTVCITDDPSQKQLSPAVLAPGDYVSISVNSDYSTVFSEVILKSQEKTYKTKEFKKRQQKKKVKKNTKKRSKRSKEKQEEDEKDNKDKAKQKKTRTETRRSRRRKKSKKAKRATARARRTRKKKAEPKIINLGTHTNSQDLRYRPLVIISNGKDDAQQDLVKNANRRLNGDGKKVSITVKSPYTPTGEIWGIGQYVSLNDEIMGVKGSYIISDLSFSLSDSGFETNMDLCLPHVFNMQEMTPAQRRLESKSIFADLLGVFFNGGKTSSIE